MRCNWVLGESKNDYSMICILNSSLNKITLKLLPYWSISFNVYQVVKCVLCLPKLTVSMIISIFHSHANPWICGPWNTLRIICYIDSEDEL
jgi:hypothetical protein